MRLYFNECNPSDHSPSNSHQSLRCPCPYFVSDWRSARPNPPPDERKLHSLSTCMHHVQRYQRVLYALLSL